MHINNCVTLNVALDDDEGSLLSLIATEFYSVSNSGYEITVSFPEILANYYLHLITQEGVVLRHHTHRIAYLTNPSWTSFTRRIRPD